MPDRAGWRHAGHRFVDLSELRDACDSAPHERGDLVGALRAIARHPRLSIRDRQVLTLTAKGYTHGEIARRLGIARSAVGREVARATARLVDT